MNWPPGTPPTIRSQLQALADAHQLSGVAPQILAAICRFTSNWGLTGLGINATGYGGYFGQHVGWSYPGRPQGFTDAQLTTPSTFATQARVAAATLSGYGAPLGPSLSIYVSGMRTRTTDPFVRYVLESTGATGAGIVTQSGGTPVVVPPLPKGVSPMAVTIGTGIIAVTGVSAGHKMLFTAPVADRATAADWSIMDLSDAAVLQHVQGATSFTS